ncbi:hypothetical protein FRC07_007513, partial [Ceratobasidium sp. 392]
MAALQAAEAALEASPSKNGIDSSAPSLHECIRTRMENHCLVVDQFGLGSFNMVLETYEDVM